MQQRSPVRRRGDALGHSAAPPMPLTHPHSHAYHPDPLLPSQQQDERAAAFLLSGANSTTSLEKLHPFASQFHSSVSSSMSNPSLFSYGRSAPGGVSMCSIRDAEQGIYEYLAEKHEPQLANSGALGAFRKKPKPFSIPIRISGWLWRKEGLFRKFKRRFCVFKADLATLFIFSSDDLTNGKLLNRFVLTQVTLADKQSREFRVQGYLQEREIHKKQSDSMARRKSSLPRAMPGDKQRFYLPEEETLRAVSEKSLTVWSHCFRNHMKSAIRIKRLQRNMLENSNLNFDSDDDEDEDMDEDGDTDDDINPDFQFDEPERRQRQRRRESRDTKQSIARYVNGTRYNNNTSDDEDEGSDGMENRDDRSPSEQLRFDQENVLRITTSYQALPSTTFFEGYEDEHLGGDDVYNASYDQNGSNHFADSSNSNSFASRSELERTNPAKPSLPLSLSSSSTSGSSSTAGKAAPAPPTSTGSSSIWEDEELMSYRVDFDAIKKKWQLSVGAFGEVWLAKYRSSQLVVVKHLKDGTNNQTRKDIQLFLREIKILCKLTHKRIVTFLGVAWTMERDVQLMMEFVPGGDLRSYLNRAKQSNDGIFTSQWTWTAHQWRIAIDVIEALVYLHSLNPILLHCDIKSHNVLLGENLRAKITDFGISRYVEPEPSIVATGSNQDQGSSDSNSESLGSGWDGLGTGRWMAPEILSGDATYSVASDVYAFGVVLSEIDTCEMPYHDRIVDNADGRVVLSEDILVHQIMGQGWRPTFTAQCPDVVKELALRCLAIDPEQRPTSLEVAYRLRKAANQRENEEDLISQMTDVSAARG